MKVVSYVHAYVPNHNGGAETTLHDLNLALINAGHECIVVIKETPFREVRRDYEVEGVKVVHAVDKRTILHYVGLADLLLTHLECSVRATILGKRFRVPVAQIVHNDLGLTKNYLAHGPDMVVYNTDWIRNDFSKDFGHLPSITVHPPVLAERYKTGRGKKVTLVNLFERKGSNVFYALAERFPGVEFLAVKGGYGEQVLRHDLPNVEIMENDFDVRNVYAKTKIILMPSVYESYGRVACEAAASGIPSIVSPTPGLMEALGEAGTYVDPGDLDGWETALRSLLAPRRYGAMSRLALDRSRALDTMAKKELDSFVLFSEQFVKIYNGGRR